MFYKIRLKDGRKGYVMNTYKIRVVKQPSKWAASKENTNTQ